MTDGIPGLRRRALTVAAASVCLFLAACASQHVAPPPDDATPEQVVQAYAHAVHAGDCATAAGLVATTRQTWCGSVDITALQVTRRTQERKATVAGDGPMVQRVWVDLTSHGGDNSLPDGQHLWSYLLDRTGPHGAWRIYDQGLG